MLSLNNRLPTVEEKARELVAEFLRNCPAEPLIIEIRVRYPLPEYANARDRNGTRCIVCADRVYDGEEDFDNRDEEDANSGPCDCPVCSGRPVDDEGWPYDDRGFGRDVPYDG